MTVPGGANWSMGHGGVMGKGIHLQKWSWKPEDPRRICAAEWSKQKRNRTEGSQQRWDKGIGRGGGKGKLAGIISDEGHLELGGTRGDAGDLDVGWDQWRRKGQGTGHHQRVNYIHLNWREQFNLRAGVMNGNQLQDAKLY